MKNSFYVLLFLLAMLGGCRQPYEPPANQLSNGYLVVDGVINTLPNSRTEFKLSRSKGLGDNVSPSAETGASVRIEARGGTAYDLMEQGAGIYSKDGLSLTASDTYRLSIRTRNGNQYSSDYVPVKQTPPIDSLSWRQNQDVTVYAHTHDPTNQSRFYRWEVIETWQYRSTLIGNFGLGVNNGIIFYKDVTTQTNDCWMTSYGNDIAIASSLQLSDDVIERQAVVVVPQNSEKIGIRYSPLVRQYALTEEAFKYWEAIRNSSQNLGGLFDPQAGQVKGNLRNAANASEPVIGYVSACAVQEKRLFIAQGDLTSWNSLPPVPICDAQAIRQNPSNAFLWEYADTTFGPWYFITGGGIMIAKKDCIDCRRRGGTNQKPSFW